MPIDTDKMLKDMQNELRNNIEVLMGQVEALKKQKENHQLDISSLMNEKDRLREEIKDLEKTIKTATDKAFSKERDTLLKKENELDSTRAELKNKESETIRKKEIFEQKIKDSEKLKDNLERTNVKLEAEMYKLDKLQEKIKNIFQLIKGIIVDG